MDGGTEALDLARERDRLRELRLLLEREQKALVAGESELLAAFAEEKAKRLVDLKRLADARAQQLARAGLSLDAMGMTQWLAEHADDGARRLWNEIDTLVRAVRDANRLNGIVIDARLKYTQTALASLHRGTGNAVTYGPDGTTRYTSPGRDLAAA